MLSFAFIFTLTLTSREIPRFAVICKRNVRNQLRATLLTLFRLLQSILLAVILGLFYFQLGTDMSQIYDRQGALFFIAIQQSISAMFMVINIFQSEKRIYHREHNQGLFGSFTYYLGKVISESPFFVLSPILFTSIVYPLIGLRQGWDNFLLTMVTLIMVTFTSQSAGLLIRCVVNSGSLF